MTVTTKRNCTDKQAVLKLEAEQLKNLITRRHNWLEKPGNIMKGTYNSVLTDTKEMEAEYQDLLKQIKS